ncbi:MAG: RHS repeat-associated core domain-containing protein [Planctomycetota bacterium]|nr:MAG: RHS repeat-associated core domain-containing protein [Planctomycetota bacterium]
MSGSPRQNWALSAVGDWNTFTDAGVAQTRTHGPAHEILTMGMATVTHDSRGNMTVDEQAKAFTWDTSNMLQQAVVPAGSMTGTAGTHLYKYDALGRRIAKTTDSTGTPFTTVYVHVGQQVYAEYQSSQPYSNPLRKYAYGSYVDEPVLLVDRTPSGSVGAGVDERFYYHRNQQYSVTALTDQSGSVVERYAYTAYGEPTILDGAGTTTRTSSAYGNPYLYTARAYDSESGLYYFRARMYEGRKGRFLSHDPIMYPDGANTYAGWFAMSRVDSNGKQSTAPELLNKPMDYEVYAEHTVKSASQCPSSCCVPSGKCSFEIKLMRVCDSTSKTFEQDRYVLRLSSTPTDPGQTAQIDKPFCYGGWDRLQGQGGVDFTLTNGRKCRLDASHFPDQSSPMPSESFMNSECGSQVQMRIGTGFGEYLFGPHVTAIKVNFSIVTECICAARRLPGNASARDITAGLLSIDKAMNDNEIFPSLRKD